MRTLQPGVKEQYKRSEVRGVHPFLGRDLKVHRVPSYGCIGRTGDDDGHNAAFRGLDLRAPASCTDPTGD